jgi:hypothetical protein
MNKEVIKKLLIIALPLVVGGVGYLIYTDLSGKEEKEKTTEFESLVYPEVAESEVESKIEAFENAKREREKKEQMDRQAGDYNFFLGVGSNEEEGEPKQEDPVVEEKQQYQEPPATPRKQRVYYQPAEKKVEPAPAVVEKKVELSRSGFTSQLDNTMQDQEMTAGGRSDVIECEVYKSQLAENGKTITLRVLKDAFFEGKLIPRNTFIYSKASIQTQAVNLAVNSIKIEDNFYQVNLSGYGASGNKGLTAEGNMGQDLLKEGANDAIGEVRTTISLPVVGSLSMSGAKKKANEQGVTIPDGTLVYLKQ